MEEKSPDYFLYRTAPFNMLTELFSEREERYEKSERLINFRLLESYLFWY